MGPSLSNLLATGAGKVFELKPFSGLKLLDITLPAEFLNRYQGPQMAQRARGSFRVSITVP